MKILKLQEPCKTLNTELKSTYYNVDNIVIVFLLLSHNMYDRLIFYVRYGYFGYYGYI